MDTIINDLLANQGQPRLEQVELVGTQLRLEATFDLRHCTRLTDFLNAQDRYASASAVSVIGPAGLPVSEEMPQMLVSLADINFVAQRVAAATVPMPGTYVHKIAHRVLLTTPGHMITGDLSLYEGSTFDGFIFARDPQFIPIQNATVRKLSETREGTYYDLVLLNRTFLTSAGEFTVESESPTAEQDVEAVPADVAIAD